MPHPALAHAGARRRPLAVAVAALLALAVGGAGACSGEDGAQTSGPVSSLIPGATFAPTTPPEPPVPPEVLAEVPGPVAIVDLAFEPATIEVAAGGTVTWTNQGDEDHWVLGDDVDVADSAPLEPGNSYAATFPEPGTYGYFCNVHPDMRGTVVVRPATGDGDDRG